MNLIAHIDCETEYQIHIKKVLLDIWEGAKSVIYYKLLI